MRFWQRWRRSQRFDEDWQAEMEHHLAMKQAALEAQGLVPDEAYRQARLRFGASGKWSEHTRSIWLSHTCESLIQDIRFGLRILRRDRAYSTVALLTIALGLGANTAIFSLLNGLLWRALPVAAPEQLVRLRVTNLPPSDRQWRGGREVQAVDRLQVPYPLYQTLALDTTHFSGWFGLAGHGPTAVEVDGIAHRLNLSTVTGTYFPVLGVSPAYGRLLDQRDDRIGEPQGGWGVVLNHAVATRLFGAPHLAIGRPIQVERRSMYVAGVTPASFTGIHPGYESEIWLPVAALESLFPDWKWRTNSEQWMLQVFGRLHPSITLDVASSRLRSMSEALLTTIEPAALKSPDRTAFRNMKLELLTAHSGYSWLTLQYGPVLYLLLGAVVAVLLLAVTNLANLALARGTARRAEIEVRLALGAGPARVRRQLLMESGLLAVGGLLLGLALSFLIRDGLLWSIATHDSAVPLHAPLDGRVMGFIAFILAFVIAVSGWAPAWFAVARRQPRALSVLRASLLVTQIALTLTLTLGAGLLGTSLRNLLSEKTGFSGEAIVFFQPDFFNAGIPVQQHAVIYRRLLDELRSWPDVKGAAWSAQPPLSGTLQAFSVDYSGSDSVSPKDRMVYAHRVTEGYFAAVGLPIIAGQDFRASSFPQAILSANLARRIFGSPAAAIGQQVRPSGQQWLRIVGVAQDAKYLNLRETDPPTIYTSSWDQPPRPGMTLVLRGPADPQRVIAAIRKELGKLPFITRSTLAANIQASIQREKILTLVLTCFSAFAFLISGTGVAGLFSYAVTLRRREIAIRIALGETTTAVAARFSRHGLLLATIGIVCGACFSYWARQSLDSYQFGVAPTHPPVWVSAIAALLVLSALASWLPALRAARTNPAILLKAD